MQDLSALAADSNPKGVAFGDGVDGQELTWAAFDKRSNRAANALGEYLGQGDRVAFICESSVDHVTAWNGALKAGCIVSNLHAQASPATLQYNLDELRPRVLVVDETFSEMVESCVLCDVTTDPQVVVTLGEIRADNEVGFEALLEGHGTDAPDVHIREDDIAAVIWTSGTTGRPTGWCLSNRAFYERGLKLGLVKGYGRRSRRVQVLSPSFAAWYSGTAPAMVTQAGTYFLRDWDPEDYLRVIEQKDQTHATLVPTMWRELVNHERFDDYDLSSLERITAAGEPLDGGILSLLQEKVCERVTNAYAATEVLGTAISDKELEGQRVESVGRPLPGTDIRVVEEGGPSDAVLPPGEVGEIIIDGTDAVSWAWGDTAKTESSFRDGWWYSGDLGYRDEAGFLYLEGRQDFVILSKGIKVYPPPVEERLTAHPGVEEAAVFGVDDEEYGEKVAALVRRSDPSVTAEDLEAWCLESDSLARYERPREYRFVDGSLPRTATGKLDRMAAAERTPGDDDSDGHG